MYTALDFPVKLGLNAAIFDHWRIDLDRLSLNMREAGYPEYNTMNPYKRHDSAGSGPTPGAAPAHSAVAPGAHIQVVVEESILRVAERWFPTGSMRKARHASAA